MKAIGGISIRTFLFKISFIYYKIFGLHDITIQRKIRTQQKHCCYHELRRKAEKEKSRYSTKIL